VNETTEMIIDFASASGKMKSRPKMARTNSIPAVYDISSNSAISMETIGDIPNARVG
jgi:hypothetical protein